MFLSRIRQRNKKGNYGQIAGSTAMLLLAVLSPFFSPSRDFQVFYREAALTGDYSTSVYSPYPAYWLILPYASLPVLVGNILWNLSNAAGFLYALRHWKSNVLAFSLSLPCFWIFYSGQMEGFMAAGIVMALTGNIFIAGLGITLLSLKPQLGVLPILFVLLQRRNWKLLIVPGVVYALSFIFWGWWIPDWLETVLRKGDGAAIEFINVGLYPAGLIFLLLLWYFRSSLKIWMLVESLSSPYFPVYSLAPYFTLEAPALWLNLFIWLLFLTAPQVNYPVRPAFVIPLAMLIILLVREWRERKQATLERSQGHHPVES